MRNAVERNTKEENARRETSNNQPKLQLPVRQTLFLFLRSLSWWAVLRVFQTLKNIKSHFFQRRTNK